MLKLETITEKTGKSVNEAVEEALSELNLSQEDVNIEVIDEGNKGFLGIGSKEAKVVVSVKEPVSYKAKAFLSQIFADMKLDVKINTRIEEDNLLVDLSGENMGIIIGKRGDTLDSLQYLTSLVVNHDSEDYYKVTLNTENYREKRLEALSALSKRLADKVARTGKKYTLEPMNPYERRIIHSNLQDNEEVTTFSVGEDPYRKVVIAPKNPAPYYKRKPTSSANNTYPGGGHAYDFVKHSDFESYAESNLSEEAEQTEE